MNSRINYSLTLTVKCFRYFVVQPSTEVWPIKIPGLYFVQKKRPLCQTRGLKKWIRSSDEDWNRIKNKRNMMILFSINYIIHRNKRVWAFLNKLLFVSCFRCVYFPGFFFQIKKKKWYYILYIIWISLVVVLLVIFQMILDHHCGVFTSRVL